MRKMSFEIDVCIRYMLDFVRRKSRSWEFYVAYVNKNSLLRNNELIVDFHAKWISQYKIYTVINVNWIFQPEILFFKLRNKLISEFD